MARDNTGRTDTSSQSVRRMDLGDGSENSAGAAPGGSDSEPREEETASRDGGGDYQFRVDASVVFQLGESLISDVVQALVELAKNAYDADASYVRIVVDTESAPPNAPDGAAPGYILIEDDGVGMTAEAIRRGWLTISNSPKRNFKREGRVTARGRTPLGDKGLGRLGVQRLGDRVRIVTRATDEHGNPAEEHVVAFSWRDFGKFPDVARVPVDHHENRPPTRRRGTSILVTDLHEAETWDDSTARRRLQDELSQMISPYEAISDFRALVTVNGTKIDLAEVTKHVRDTARVHYDVTFDGQGLTIEGRAKLTFFRPQGGEELEEYRELLERDKGERFLAFLKQRADGRFGIQRARGASWYLTFSFARAFDDIPKRARVRGAPANPGPFTAEVDAFDFGAEAMREQQVFSRAGDYKKYLQALSGIRVYRNGFGIRVDRDWLGLAKASTSGSSYYGLRPFNTIGYVALTARDNPQLEEKTDREGFKITPHYENFYLLMTLFRGFTSEVQDFLRREYLAFRDLHQVELAKLQHDPSPEELVEQIREGVVRARNAGPTIRSASAALERIDTNASSIEALAAVAANGGDEGRQAVRQLTAHWTAVARTAATARKALQEVDVVLEAVAELAPASKLLASEVSGFRGRLEEVYELASLGLTTEVLAHEISNVAQHLRGRTRQADNYLRRKQIRDAELIAFVEDVSATVDALRKQLGHLDPALRFARERREVIPLREFFDKLGDFYAARLGARRIEWRVTTPGNGDFAVRMSRGRLVQVIDNLVLNSEYWLGADLEADHIERAVIKVQINAPHVRIGDSGRGVLPELEGSLFEPFVTGKGQGRGRGLGLFIVSQLLDADDCRIALAPERNQYGRRFMFDIDFTGALDDRR